MASGTPNEVVLTVSLPEHLAMPLAQFLKRLTFGGARECAVDDDEAYRMLDALDQVRRALADKGYSPR